ncbi:MAG: protein-glutamate O-methyltransferase CheR [Myxococcales bacterium]|nr:protein-glutamate O-methyltransferase CheR [Myxococcales bacterium]
MRLPSTAQVQRFRARVTEVLGLQHDDSRLEMLGKLLMDRCAASGARDLETYLALMGTDDERRALARALTVGESYFFRVPAQMQAFAEVALAAALDASDGGSVRVLSAACAGGEEPYSLAITARERLPAEAARRVEVRAIDVNPAALERARRARYSAWAFRDVPDAQRARWFRQRGAEFELDPAIREAVTFDELNLAGDAPLPRDLDVIFCRNVLMYFAPDVMRRVVDRLTASLRPGGYLFLGASETLRGLSTAYELCHTHQTFYYRLRPDGAEPHAPPPTLTPSPTLPPLDATWVQAIQRGAERVRALTEQPTPRAERARPSPRSSLERALLLFREERFDEAMAALEGADHAQDPDALLARAALLTNMGRFDEADEACADLLALDDLSGGAHYLRALCREHRGDLEGAIREDELASHLDPRFALPAMHLGLLTQRRGDSARAARCFARAIDLLHDEEPERLLLFGGGFDRAALLAFCRARLHSLEAPR